MAIRITHAKAGTIAKFGIAAGVGEQRVRQEAEAQANARQQAVINAETVSQSIRVQADINQSILDAQNRQDALEFESFLKAESAKRSMAWEQEKIEITRTHAFEMLEQTKEMENQLKISDDLRDRSKLNTKFKALDDAAERGDITEEQATNEKLRLEIGVSGTQSALFKKKDEADIFAGLLKEREAASAVPPEQKNSAALLEFVSAKSTSKEDRKDIEDAIATGDSAIIKTTLDVMQAKESQIIQQEKISQFGGLVAERKRRPTPIFSPLTSGGF